MGQIALALVLLVLAGCARSEPPAPIVDRTRTEPPTIARTATGILTRLVSFSKPAKPASDVEVAPLRPSPGQQVAAATPNDPPKSQTYTVQRGDTVSRIARRHSVPPASIIGVNSLKPPYLLRVGQRLTIPPRNIYLVQAGDTLYGLSRRYAMPAQELARLNHLQQPYRLIVGQQLVVPRGGETPPATVAVAKQPEVAHKQPEAVQVAALPTPRLRPATIPQPRLRPTAPARAPGPVLVIGTPPARAGGGFAWPVKGELLTRFGPLKSGRRNDGLNIAAPRGTPVQAAENGVVAYAGNEIRGFGNLILLKHEGGVITAYAHAEALLVRRGDIVKKGQVIARVGSSGGVAAPQLHFEIRKGAEAIDPATLLVSS